MLPWRYGLPVLVVGLAVLLLIDVSVAVFVLVLAAGLTVADYIWWRRYAPR